MYVCPDEGLGGRNVALKQLYFKFITVCGVLFFDFVIRETFFGIFRYWILFKNIILLPSGTTVLGWRHGVSAQQHAAQLAGRALLPTDGTPKQRRRRRSRHVLPLSRLTAAGTNAVPHGGGDGFTGFQHAAVVSYNSTMMGTGSINERCFRAFAL